MIKFFKTAIIPVALLLGMPSAFAQTINPIESRSVNIAATDISVFHTDTANDYRIVWDNTVHGPVSIEVGLSSDFAAGDGTTIAREATGNSFSWSANGRHVRRYFLLTDANGQAHRVASRVLPLQGGRNFRDLGGYETTDGHSVKWGKLFRSGSMTRLTDGDYRYLSDLGIRVVCDFRANEERESEPTRWAAGDIDYVTWDYSQKEMMAEFQKLFRSDNLSAAYMKTAFQHAYRTMVIDHKDKFREVFDRLKTGEVPLAFNCSAGKDRTGISAALILTALGVDREQVIQDYALSEQVVDFMAAFRDPKVLEHMKPEQKAMWEHMSPEVLEPMMRTDPDYIRETFKSLEEQYGSVLNFIQQELNVSDADLVKLRATLLD